MCGIAGIIKFRNNSTDLSHIKKMTDIIRHRGPDDEGFVFIAPHDNKLWLYGGKDTPDSVYTFNSNYTPKERYSGQKHRGATIVFGHRRLSILDLSPAGHQPMSTGEGRFWIVYNGEIYNYLQLREELVRAGHTFYTNSDTEILLKAYAQWGRGCLNRLIGMFAFAIYDNKDKTIFLARDFFGIKPLYYVPSVNCFAFASEIKSLLTIPHSNFDANPQRIFEYLRFGLTDYGGETFFKNILQLPAAHFLHIDLKQHQKIEPCQYWDIDLNKKTAIPINDAASRIKELFLKNIKIHLRSDVPLGAALSGGIDSSAIVMSMRALEGQSFDLHTFSYIADDPQLNEERWVDIAGFASGAYVHKVTLSPDSLISDLERLIHIQDEPFVSTSIYAQYCVMNLASRNGIKVMLDGQGADELLAGYPIYLGTRLAGLIRNFRWLHAIRFIRRSAFNGNIPAAALLINTGKYFLPGFLENSARKMVGDDPLPRWIEKAWLKKFDVKTIYSPIKIHRNVFRRELYRSMFRDKLQSYLRYEDRNAMAHSIESRLPFLTTELVSYIFSLPEDFIIDDRGTTKAIFRAAMREIVPDTILNRTDKIGFQTPDFLWKKSVNNWTRQVLTSETAHAIPMLDQKQLINEWERMLHNLSPFNYYVWRWINLIKWTDHFSIQYN